MKFPQLGPAEARVAAAMFEKHRAVPDNYPLSANAIMVAANQKTARSPVMALTEGEVLCALTALEGYGFVRRADEGSRVPKWREHFAHALMLDPPVAALLAVLVLRGPQTLSEARGHAEPLGGPGDGGRAQELFADLAGRAEPMVVELSRAPGQSATRWVHLLCGMPDASAFAVTAPTASPRAGSASGMADDARLALLETRIMELERRLADLETRTIPLPRESDSGLSDFD